MLLGLTGNTGKPTSGPHLHFQIKYLGLLCCPQTFLWDLYLQKALTAHDVYNLPTTGCTN